VESKDKSTTEAVEQASDTVGYCCPPVTGRFKKGQSGNPKGRPTGRGNVATVLAKALHEKVVIKEGGRRKTISKLEAAAKQLANKAASGELKAVRHVLELSREAEVGQAAQPAEREIGELDREVIESLVKRFQMTGALE